MDCEFTAEQEQLRDAVRRYLHERAPLPYVRRMYHDRRATTPEVWRGLADLGLTGILVPEEHGGGGRGMVDVGVVLEELGRAVHPGPFLSSAVGAVGAVLAAGSPADHADLLPGLAAGEVIGTVAVHEPGRRHEWRAPSTTAEPAGAGWTVSGTKAWVPDGQAADLLVVAAAAGDGVALVAVEAGADGVGVIPTATVDGSRRWATVTLDRARGRRLGGGDGAGPLAGVLDRLAVGWVVDGVGAAARALELAVDHARERVQFDRPIGSFQAVQHLCADMLHDVELARAGAYYALWCADAAPGEELHRAATMAKAFSSDALCAVGAAAIQVFGGVGFTWEHDVHLFYKRLLSLQHDLGGSSRHLEELATIALG